MFSASNNEAEYEALIAGLKLDIALGVRHINIYSDSQLVVYQVTSQYQAKEERMVSYLQLVSTLLSNFLHWNITQIPRTKNANADILVKLASSAISDVLKSVPVKYLEHPSIVIPYT